MPLNPKRCKQCIKSHRQCDLEQPKCGRCKKLRLECIYINKVRIRFVQAEVSKEKSVSKLKAKSLDILVKSNTSPTVDLQLCVSIKRKFFDLFTFKRYLLDKECCSKYRDQVINRYYIDSYMTSLQYPSIIESIGPIFEIIDSLAFIECQISYTAIQEPYVQPHQLEWYYLNHLLTQSVFNYFKYFNTVIPLFEEKSFKFIEQPPLLRFSILACGLTFMQSDLTVNYLIGYFDSRIKSMIFPLPRLQPTLANVQALLILALGFKCSLNFYEAAYIIEIFAYQFSTTLGLHLASIKSHKKKQRERAMVYTCLNTLYLIESLCFGSRVPSPTTLSDLLKPNTQIPNYKANLKDCIEHTNLNLIYYYSELNHVVYEIRMLKERYLDPSSCKKELKESNNNIIIKLEQLKKKYNTVFISSTSMTTSLNLTTHQLYICFFYHYLTHFTITLKLYHPLCPINLNSEPLQKKSKIILLALEHAFKGIEYGTQLPLSIMLPLGFYLLSELASFVIRFKEFSETKLTFHSLKCIQIYFIKAQQSPYITLQSRSSIMFILNKINQSSLLSKSKLSNHNK